MRAVLGLVIAAGCVAAGMEGRRYALSSPRFGLTYLTFEGLHQVSQAELGRLSGLAPGQNLFALDLDAVQHTLELQPWVKHAGISRQLPGTLHIAIEEHQAAGVANLGDLYLVNAEGSPFKKLEPKDQVDLPLLTGIDRDAYMQDTQKAATAFREALALVKAYEASDVAPSARLSEVRHAPDGLVLVTEAGEEIRFAAATVPGALPDALKESLQRLFKVRSELARRGLVAQVIRLDNRTRPDRVTVKVFDSSSERK